jgi:hypothetical protein
MPINTLIAQGFPRSQMNLSEEQGNILRNNMLRQRLGSYEEDRNILREKMQMEKDQLQIEKNKEQRAQEESVRKKMNEPWEDMATTIQGIDLASNYLTPENHDEFVNFANNQKGTNRFLKLPTLKELEQKAMSEGVTDSGQFRNWYEQYKQKSLVSLKTQAALLKAQGEPKVVPAGGVLASPGGKPLLVNPAKGKEYEPQKFVKDGQVFWLKPGDAIPPGAQPYEKSTKEAQPEIVKLIDAMNATDDEETKRILSARVNKLTETSGLSVRMNKDGEFELVQGPGVKAGVSGFGKTATTKVEEKLIDATESLSRLSAIDGLFKSEFQEMGTKWNMWTTAFKEKAGYKLNEGEKKSLEDFSKYRRRSYEHLNKYLNEISGAAITEQESKRLKKALPDPGENIWDGDSPTEFKAKLDDVIQSTKWAIARQSYALKNGLNWKTISLENMPDIVNERAAQIEAEVKKPGMDAGVVRRQVKLRLEQEFGLLGK